MRDILDRELMVGNTVAFCTLAEPKMIFGTYSHNTSVFPNKIVVSYYTKRRRAHKYAYLSPNKVLKI